MLLVLTIASAGQPVRLVGIPLAFVFVGLYAASASALGTVNVTPAFVGIASVLALMVGIAADMFGRVCTAEDERRLARTQAVEELTPTDPARREAMRPVLDAWVKMIATARAAGLPVIYTTPVSRADGADVVLLPTDLSAETGVPPLTNGIEGTPMPGNNKLTEQEVWDLVNYVQSLPYESISDPRQADPENQRERL